MALWVTRNEFYTILVIAVFCNVKAYVTYDLDVRNTYGTPTSELNRPIRTGVLEPTGEYIRNFVPPHDWKEFQDEGSKGDNGFNKMMVQLMKNINKEVRKRGIQALAKNGDFPKKNEKPRLQDMIVTNYTFPNSYNRQHEY